MGIPLNIDPEKQSFELYDDLDYKEFWVGWQQRKLDQAERAIVKQLLPTSGRRLIDLGCGYGRLSACYMERFKQVILFDGSLAFLHEARNNTGGKAIYIAGDVNRLPFRTASFDSILLVRVLHHVADSKACMSELNRILAGSGRLVFTYRNKLYFMNILHWLAHPRSRNPFTLEPADVGTTLISHHPADIRRILKQTGFTRIRSRGLGVLDRVANLIKPYGRFAPTGTRLAPLFGWLKLAPWMFCAASAKSQAELIEDENIESILSCLECGGGVALADGGYHCLTCHQRYPIIDGVIDFRPKES